MATPHRLRAAGQIRRTVAVRHAAGSESVVVHANVRSDTQPARVAVVAGRRVGGAVARNRAKRRLRAVLRSLDLPVGVDLVVSAKAGADDVPFDQLTTAVTQCVRRAHQRATQQAVPAR